MAGKTEPREKAVDAARHCINGLPYTALVYVRHSPQGVPLYQVAGSNAGPAGAKKALATAHKVHGGSCHYCRQPVTELTIDHAESVKSGGSESLQNLLIACKPCNSAKNHKPIEAYKPEAGREWLQALLVQVQERLNRIPAP